MTRFYLGRVDDAATSLERALALDRPHDAARSSLERIRAAAQHASDGGRHEVAKRRDSARGRTGSTHTAGLGKRRASRSPPALARALFDGLIHAHTPDEPRWGLAPLVLVAAFAARAAVALSGDFVLHPDEIMQYLEPAHRLVFGNGVIYWEYFYGARSWLIPGTVAAVLKLFDLVGLGEPAWYVGGVKLLFCAPSLAIPAGMYCFARRHFGESPARLALLAGAFWYELAAFAHKPLTELVATAPLIGLLALCVRPSVDRPQVICPATAGAPHAEDGP